VEEGWVFPGTWKAAIVEENISLLELAKRALLLVLLDWVTNLIGSNLVLFTETELMEVKERGNKKSQISEKISGRRDISP